MLWFIRSAKVDAAFEETSCSCTNDVTPIHRTLQLLCFSAKNEHCAYIVVPIVGLV